KAAFGRIDAGHPDHRHYRHAGRPRASPRGRCERRNGEADRHSLASGPRPRPACTGGSLMTEPIPSSTLEMGYDPKSQETLPWPPRGGTSAVGAFLRTWVESVFRPGAFFSRIPESGGTDAALLYYGIIGLAGAVGELISHLFCAFDIGVFAYVTRIYEALGLAIDAFSPIIGFLFAPAILAITLAFAFVVIHVGLWIFGGARRGAGTTLRVLCYAYGPRIFGIIPIFGGLVGTI